MKKAVLTLCVWVVTGVTVFAQTYSEQLEANLAAVENLKQDLEGGKRLDVLTKMEDLKVEILTQLHSELVAALPEKVDGWLKQSTGQSRRIVKFEANVGYEPESSDKGDGEGDGKEKEKKSKRGIVVKMNDQVKKAGHIYQIHEAPEKAKAKGIAQGEPVLIKGHKGLITTEERMTLLEFIYGDNLYVRVEGIGMQDSKSLKKIANAIDFDKLKYVYSRPPKKKNDSEAK